MSRAHPALGIMAIEGRRISEVANDAGYCAAYVSRVLRRQMPVTEEFRRRLVAVLGRPANELFDDLKVSAA